MRGFSTGLVLGIIVGAAGFWFVQKKGQEHPEAQQRYEQSAAQLRTSATEAAHNMSDALRAKLDTLMEALNEQFGTSAEFEDPKGGIFLWVKLPDNVDTMKLYQAALAAGVAINPGPEWSTDKAYAGSRLRLCFASPSHEQIREGVAVLAEVCRKEFGVPARIANVEKHARI